MPSAFLLPSCLFSVLSYLFPFVQPETSVTNQTGYMGDTLFVVLPSHSSGAEAMVKARQAPRAGSERSGES